MVPTVGVTATRRFGGGLSGPRPGDLRGIMRFILKCAFWLGLVAFLLPFGEHKGETTAEISWLGAFAGVQEAIEDLGGFCDRAPRACDTGREVALFAGERIADGVAIAYDFVDTRRAAATDVDAAPLPHKTGPDASPDPLMTGGVSAHEGAPVLPRAYIAPKRGAAAVEAEPARSAPAAVPTPAPRV